jgi:hypothetical protein
MASKGGAGKQLALLVVLLAILGGAGYWNYQRNLAAEEQVPRPFKGYAEADLDSMAEAYRQEVEQYSKQWEAARAQRTSASGRGHLDDRAREFDRIYDHGREVRSLKSKLADRQVVLGQIEEELRLRRGEGDRRKVFLRRLLTFG